MESINPAAVIAAVFLIASFAVLYFFKHKKRN